MKAIQLNATKREKAGKGASRAIRRTGDVPAVIYGEKQAPVMISLPEKVIVAQMAQPGIWTRQFDINVDGQRHHVLCQDIQKHPISNRPVHADFLRISKNAVLTLDVPVHYQNEEIAPGIKMGGVLNIVHRTIEVKCKADNMPEALVVDLANAEMGDSIMASAIQLPAGVELTEDEDFTIATIVGASQGDTAQDVAADEATAAAASAASATEAK